MAEAPPRWSYRERIKIRYQEVDLQNVVFNAHYLSYIDVACAAWMHEAMGWTGVGDDTDWMLVKVQLEWQGAASYGDHLDVDCRVARWGRTSFDLDYAGSVADRPVFTATVTYVCIEPGTATPTPVSDRMRTALSMAEDPGADS